MHISGQSPSEPPIDAKKPTSFSAEDIGLPDSFTNGTSLDTAKKAEGMAQEVKSPIQEAHVQSPKFMQAFCAGLLLPKRP